MGLQESMCAVVSPHSDPRYCTRIYFQGDHGLSPLLFFCSGRSAHQGMERRPSLHPSCTCVLSYGFYCSNNFYLSVFFGGGRKEIRREEAEERMCFWTLLSLQLISGACHGVSALTIPEEDLRGKWLKGSWLIRYLGGRKPGEGPCRATLSPFGTDLVPSANLAGRDMTQFPEGGTGAEV